MSKLEVNITEADLRRAELIRIIEQIRPIDEEGLFRGAVLCVLVGAERYETARNVYSQVMEAGFRTPEAVLADPVELKAYLGKSRWPGRRMQRLTGLSRWWQDSPVPAAVVADATNGKDKGVELRAEVAEGERNGLGYKSASLLLTMVGYDSVAPIDRHMCREMVKWGFPIKIPDDVKVGALQRRDYLQAEEWFSEIASSLGYTPAHLHRILWAKTQAAIEENLGAGDGNRTRDLVITNDVLYH